jgi:hypothetical protein
MMPPATLRRLFFLSLLCAASFAALKGFAQGPDRPPSAPPPNLRGPGSGQPGGPHHHPPPPPLLVALDSDHDGVISAEEIANAPQALRSLDKNGDGKLSEAEVRPPRPPGEGRESGEKDRPHRKPVGPEREGDGAPRVPGGGQEAHPGKPSFGEQAGHPGHEPRPKPPIIRALDANGDGAISAEEIQGATAALKTLDKNGDGQLTREEFAFPPRGDRSGAEGRRPRRHGPQPGSP